jgi:hypothetical protein
VTDRREGEVTSKNVLNVSKTEIKEIDMKQNKSVKEILFYFLQVREKRESITKNTPLF